MMNERGMRLCRKCQSRLSTKPHWVDGTVTHVNLFTNSNDVGLSGTMTGSDGYQSSTDAYYTSATGPSSSIINELGYTGLSGTVDLVQLIKHHPNLGTIGPVNPVDLAIGCAATGAPKLALDLSPLSPIGMLPDVADAAMRGSFNPLFNSGDRLNDAGNAVEVAEKTAAKLAKTLPFLGSVAEKLGPAGMTISVVKAGRDFRNCVR